MNRRQERAAKREFRQRARSERRLRKALGGMHTLLKGDLTYREWRFVKLFLEDSLRKADSVLIKIESSRGVS